MGLKKTHEHESGFFEENMLTTSESSKNRFKLAAEESTRSSQQIRESSRNQTNMIDSCNNVSEKFEKLISSFSNYNTYETNQTIVIDSDEDDTNDDNRYSDRIVMSTVTNGHCSNPDHDVVDVADDSDEEIIESIQVRIGDNHVDDSADDDVDVDCSSNKIDKQQQHKNGHMSSQQSGQSKSSNTSSNNNKVQEKSKNGDTDAKSSAQLMQEIEEASTIRPQGECNQIDVYFFSPSVCFECRQGCL